jgi:hypothetical protein
MDNRDRISGRAAPASVVTLALGFLSACAGMPPIDEVETVSLETSFATRSVLAVDIDGDPEVRPGNMAMQGAIAALECHVFYVICAAAIVPLSAATGATITAITTLPETQSHELNRVSADVTSRMDLGSLFTVAMHDEALRQGLSLRERNAEARIRIYATAFDWVVSAGNNVAINMEVTVVAFLDGRRKQRHLKHRSEAAKVSEWTANDAARLRHELDTFMDEASEAVWLQILDREEETRK